MYICCPWRSVVRCHHQSLVWTPLAAHGTVTLDTDVHDVKDNLLDRLAACVETRGVRGVIALGAALSCILAGLMEVKAARP